MPKTHNLHGNFEGCGTGLKPAHEPILVARKPLEGTVEDSMEMFGTGAFNITPSRIGKRGGTKRSGQAAYPKREDGKEDRTKSWARTGHEVVNIEAGKWPSNVLFSHSPGCGIICEENCPLKRVQGQGMGPEVEEIIHVFPSESLIYCPKPGIEKKKDQNVHLTVKPLSLMRYLTRLVMPTPGRILDPFLGSGTTAVASYLEGYECTGIELEKESFDFASRRLAEAMSNGRDSSGSDVMSLFERA